MSSPPSPPWSPDAVDALRREAKRQLRKRMRGLRANLPPEARQARSAAIAAAVTALDAWRDAETVALFASLGDEVDTAPLFEAARAAGKRVALPVVPEAEGPLTWRLALDRDGAATPRTVNAWGIEEPAPEAPAVAPESIGLVVVPALVVDPRGHRIGYGRAYYDQTLPGLAHAERVVVAFEFQLLAEVPAEAHDVPAHRVVTDQRSFAAEGAPAAQRSDRTETV